MIPFTQMRYHINWVEKEKLICMQLSCRKKRVTAKAMKIIDGSKAFNMNNVMFEGKPQELMYSYVSKKIISYSLPGSQYTWAGGAGNNFKIFFSEGIGNDVRKGKPSWGNFGQVPCGAKSAGTLKCQKTAEASLKDVVWRFCAKFASFVLFLARRWPSMML